MAIVKNPLHGLFALGLVTAALTAQHRPALAFVGGTTALFSGLGLLSQTSEDRKSPSLADRVDDRPRSSWRETPKAEPQAEVVEDKPKEDEWHKKYLVILGERNQLQNEVVAWSEYTQGLEVQVDDLKATVAGQAERIRSEYEDRLTRLQYENRNLLHAEGDKLKKLRADTRELVDEYQSKLRDAYLLISEKDKELENLNNLLKVKMAAKFFDGTSTAEILGNRLLRLLVQSDYLLDAHSAKTRPDGSHVVRLKSRQPIDPLLLKNTTGIIQAGLMLEVEPEMSFSGNIFEWVLHFDTRSNQGIKTTPEKEGFVYLEVLNDRESHTCVFVAGKQGAGKSLTMQYLASTFTHQTVAISPHLRVSGDKQDFPTSKRVGGGADYEAIAAYMQYVLDLVKKRLGDYADGVKEFEPITLFIDEVPAIQRAFKSVKDWKDLLGEFLGVMMTEVRKINLQCFVGTQSTTVSSLGIPGLAALRDECSWIRLGRTAYSLATPDQLAVLEEQLSKYESEDRLTTSPPAMFNDKLLVLPSVRDMVGAITQPADKPDIPTLIEQGLSTADIVLQVYGLKPSRSKEYLKAKAEVDSLRKA